MQGHPSTQERLGISVSAFRGWHKTEVKRNTMPSGSTFESLSLLELTSYLNLFLLPFGVSITTSMAFSLSGLPKLFPDVRFFILTEFFGSGLLDETLEICSRIASNPVDSLLSHGLSGSAFAPSLFEPGINRDSCPDQGQSQNSKNCVGHDRRFGPL
jgi:hypothetical protein